MNMQARTRLNLFLSLLIVLGSVVSYRWIITGTEYIETHESWINERHREIRSLKKEIDSFNTISNSLHKDEQLKRRFFDEKLVYYSEFGREGIEQIDEILQTTYEQNGFFELKRFSFKHHASASTSAKPGMTLIIEGEKLLEIP